MEYLLVDGYNIINAWTDVFDVRREPLEDCRQKLMSMLSNYQGYKKINVIVVFDAHLVRGSVEKVEKFDNITVVYTRENETADNYIERFVYRSSEEDIMRVATSDYLEQRIVLFSGGVRMSPRELRIELSAAGRSKVKPAIKPSRDNSIMSRMSGETLEKLEKMRRSGD